LLGVLLLWLLADPVPPTLNDHAPIPYPPGAHGDARVVLELDVATSGQVTAVRVVESAGEPFDQAAVVAARGFTFEPGRFQGEAVPFRVTYSHLFHGPPAAQGPAGPAPPPSSVPTPARLGGQILERGTRAPVPLAQIRAGEVVTEADADGRFQLALPPGAHTVLVSAPEHARTEIAEQLRAGESLHVTYYIARTGGGRYETVVHGRPLREEVSRQTIEGDEIDKLPGTLGDTLRAVLNLPGVARAPFNSGLFIVRGGKPTDSRVYIEGAEVPQLYHFGALSSVVASDLVGRIDFLPGNFGVRYGRAIAGTIDLEFREPRRDRLHGEVNSSVLDTGVLVEGPLGAGAFAVAARRSYIDAILPAVLPDSADIDFTTAPRYYDYQALYSRPLGTGKLDLRVYGSDDELTFLLPHPRNVRVRGEFDTHIYFHRAQVAWSGRAGPVDLELMGSAGVQRVFASLGEGLELDLDVVSAHNRLEASRKVLPQVRVGVGLDAQLAYLAVDANIPEPPREGEVADPGSARQVIETHQRRDASAIGVYSFAELELTPRLRLSPGVRLDWFALTSAVTLDPRVEARWQLSRRSSLKGAVGLYSQEPEPQDTDPNFGNPHIGPEHALHLGAGFERLLGAGLRVSVEAFYKYLYDLSTPSTQPVVGDDGKVRREGVANQGEGFVAGGEFLIRQSLGKRLFGWLSYTLMRSERTDRPGTPSRLFDFDQTHVLTLALHANLPRGWEAGIRFRYVTGNPYTPRLGGLYTADSDAYVPIPGALNSQRLPDFQQLDLRVDKSFVFERWILALYLDVQNVYNYENVEGLRYQYDFARTAPLTGLPILPAFGVRGKF
jgi:TonB family protein